MKTLQTLRHKTALVRTSFSRPISLALAEDILSLDNTFFDYGCGRGQDVALLKEKNIKAEGFDPHYFPNNDVLESDIVNLGYVLNVIEDQSERKDVLRKVFGLAKKVLIVSVRTDNALGSRDTQFEDGLITGTGTFQKIYTQTEFKEYLSDTLGVNPVLVSPGIAYIFKNELDRASYLAKRIGAGYRAKSITILNHLKESPTFETLISAYESLGYLPSEEEFPALQSLVEKAGSLKALETNANRVADLEKLEAARMRNRENIATQLAFLRLQSIKLPDFSKVDLEFQKNIKRSYSSYKAAVEDSNKMLLSLADSKKINATVRGLGFGKIMGDEVYYHRSTIENLPPSIQLLIACGAMLTGPLEYDLVKIKPEKKTMSFLFYQDFFSKAHPSLGLSIKVDLKTGWLGVRNYSESTNPPILHRKELFIATNNEFYSSFAEFTKWEETKNLLSRTDIGFLEGWKNALEEIGLTLSDVENKYTEFLIQNHLN